jgi:hypothetical protein
MITSISLVRAPVVGRKASYPTWRFARRVRSAVEPLLAAALLLTAGWAEAALSIEHATFHAASRSAIYNESGSVDDGGALFVFVRNGGPGAEAVTNLLVNSTNVTALANFKWWRVWPKSIAPGGVATVSAKVNSAPLREGESVSLTVQAQSGRTASTSTTLTTPALRLGSVIPS